MRPPLRPPRAGRPVFGRRGRAARPGPARRRGRRGDSAAPGPSPHACLQPVVRRRRVGAHRAHLRGHVVGRLLLIPGGVMRFSFCLRLQNHTRTTSFSSCRLSARFVISCAEGLGHLRKWLSSAPLTLTSMEVRFVTLAALSAAILSMLVGLLVLESASSSHLLSSGLSCTCS